MRRFAVTFFAPLLLLTAVASANEETRDGTWTEGGQRSSFSLVQRKGAWVGTTRAPASNKLHRLTLRERSGKWELALERKENVAGAAQRLKPGLFPRMRWVEGGAVALHREGDDLVGDHTWRIHFPCPRAAAARANAAQPAGAGEVDATRSPEGAATPEGAGSQASAPDTRPVVRVLLTGFDRFPRLINHPHYAGYDGKLPPLDERQPSINPSGWAVRAFEVEQHLPAELRGRVRIELHKLNDLPVVYVESGQAVAEAIERLQPHVVISTGVGADGGADADVERTCENLMSDGWSYGSDVDHGPFQLPASWPPAGPTSEWSEEDRAWLSRYPDNNGVSYDRMPIVPGGPDVLHSTLPVERITRAVTAAGLRSIDGGGGPGRYICNNVMYRVVRAQQARGQLGGFIHLARWNESRQDSYLKVLSVAIEACTEEVLARQAAAREGVETSAETPKPEGTKVEPTKVEPTPALDD
ncbi:MAG: hypothetical protein AB7N76_07765 [Planctomycetota bacterium]